MQNPIWYSWARAACTGALVFMAGCGGGGSSSPPPPGATVIKGAAVKGVINNAAVTLVELPASLEQPAVLPPPATDASVIGTSSTDAHGDFAPITIDMSKYHGGAILGVISPKPGNVTTIKCDIRPRCSDTVAFGVTYPAPADFVLTTMLPVITAGRTHTLNATILTSLIAKRAKSLKIAAGGATLNTPADAVQRATVVVNQLAGVNVVNTKPSDLTDAAGLGNQGDAEKAYAGLVTGALASYQTGHGGESLSQQTVNSVDQLNGLLNNGDANNDGSLAAGDLQSIVNAAENQLQANGLNVPPAIDSVQALIDAANLAGGRVAPPPPPVGTVIASTDIELAKDFFHTVRDSFATFAEAADPQRNANLATQGTAVESFANDIGLVATDIKLLVACADYLEGQANGTNKGQPANCTANQTFSSATLTSQKSQSQGQSSATITRTRSTSGGVQIDTLSASGSVGDTAINSLNFSLPVQEPPTGAVLTITDSGDVQSAKVRMIIAPGSSMTVTSKDGSKPVVSQNPDGSHNVNNVAEIAFLFTASAQQTGAGFNNPLRFDGVTNIDVVGCTQNCPADPKGSGSLKSLTLSGTLTDTQSHTAQIALTANITNAASLHLFCQATACDAGPGNFPLGNVTFSTTFAPPAAPQGTPQSGTVTMSVDVTGFDSVNDRPTGTVTLAVTRNGAVLFNISSTLASQNQANPDLIGQDVTITGPGNGVVITLTRIADQQQGGNKIFGTIKVNGTNVGTLEDRHVGTPVIHFTDGSFETFQ